MTAPVAILRTPLRLPPRKDIEAAVETLVALLDALDPDPEAEDATDCEDDFTLTPLALAYAASEGPGCRIADPGGDEHDGREAEDYV